MRTPPASHRPTEHSRALTALLMSVPLALAGCANLAHRDPVQVYVAALEPLQGEGLEVRMLVKLRVQNPNDTPIQYKGVYVGMEVQGRNFGSGVSNVAGTVPAFSEAVVDVPISISALGLLRSAVGVLGAERTGKIEYELTGKLAGPAFESLRFTSKGELSLPESMDGS